MNFACIEYTTKTRRIWRHTRERPNYLCDPDREIDPTSFGAYTSALDGVHLPLTGLIYGSLESPPGRLRRLRRDLVRRYQGAFATYDLSPLASFDVLLAIYQLSYDDELVRFLKRVRQQFPETILITCSSPPFGRLLEAWRADPRRTNRYRAFLDSSHFVMNVVRATVPFYRSLTDTPTLYLPQPYPVAYAQEQARVSRPATPPRPILYVAGDTVRPDILAGHHVARVLQRRHPELLVRVTKTPEFVLNTELLRDTDFEVVPFRPWREQLRALAGTRLVLNTDMWWTRGRVPVDCAAAGVPCVGTTSDGQTELWPSLAVRESRDGDALLALAERALTDEDFRATAIAKARARLANYSYEQARVRLARSVDLARKGRLTSWRDPVWEGDHLVLP